MQYRCAFEGLRIFGEKRGARDWVTPTARLECHGLLTGEESIQFILGVEEIWSCPDKMDTELRGYNKTRRQDYDQKPTDLYG